MNETNQNLDIENLGHKEIVESNKKMSPLCKAILIGSGVILVLGAIIGIIVYFATKKEEPSSRNRNGIKQNQTDTDTNTEDIDTDTNIYSNKPTEEVIDQSSSESSESSVSSESLESQEDEKKDFKINLSYKKNNLEFVNIEKNISSNMKGKKNQVHNDSFVYNCIFGIENEINNGDSDGPYYTGFLFILNTIYKNITKISKNQMVKEYLIGFDKQLYDIIKKADQDIIKNVEREIFNYDSDKEKKAFIKFDFYQNGSYREIYKPKSISQESFDECKEILDLILPKISKNLESKNEINQERKLELLKSKFNYIKKGNNHKKSYEIIQKSSRNRNLEQIESIIDKFEDIISNESYYISNKIFVDFDLDTDEIDNAFTNSTFKPYKLDNNIIKLEINETGEVYSDASKYRGSKLENNITYILDENDLLKEIFGRKIINLSNQTFLGETDKKVYNQENSLKEEEVNKNFDVFILNVLSNVSNLYILDYIQSLSSSIDYHAIINYSEFGREIINDINNEYINNFEFDNIIQNETAKLINKINSIFPNEFLNKFKLVEANKNKSNEINDYEYLRELYGEENYTGKFYGFNKSISFRKDFFKTNLFGMDIILGMANFYYPRTGNSYNSLKLDVGELHFSEDLNSFKTNEPIITENLQQMSFKLLKLMYLTHKNLIEEKNDITFDQIKDNIKNIAENEILDLQNYDISTFYTILAANKNKYQIIINYLINGLISLNNNSKNIIHLENHETELKNAIDIDINNITNIAILNLKNLENTILLINKEINNNGDNISLYLYQDYKGIIEEIKSFINVKMKNYINKYLEEIEVEYNSTITDKIKKILSLNDIIKLKNIISENNIFNYIFSEDEKSNILSNLNLFQNYTDSNISSTLNSYISTFKKNLKDINITKSISNISNSFSEIKNFTILTENISNIDILEDFYQKNEQIDIKIKEIINEYIQIVSSNLYNLTNYIKKMINNESLYEQNEMINIAKKIKNNLMDLKNQKYNSLLDYHKTYYDKNIYDFYKILEANDEILDKFDDIFWQSIKARIINNVSHIFYYNLQLGNELYNEVMSPINECLKCDSIKQKIVNFIIGNCNCKYVINEEIIEALDYMSENLDVFINEMKNSSFLKRIEYYYNSIGLKVKNEMKLNKSFSNTIDLSYLENIPRIQKFNFNPIQGFLLNLIDLLKTNAKAIKKDFQDKVNDFINNKSGSFYSWEYYLFGDMYIAIDFEKHYYFEAKDNKKKIILSIDKILKHLEDDEEDILNRWRNSSDHIKSYFIDYYENLKEGLNNKSKEEVNKIDFNLLFYEYKNSISIGKLSISDILNNLTILIEKNISNNNFDAFFSKINELNIYIKKLLKLSKEKSFILNYEEETIDKIKEIIYLLRYIYEDINNSFEIDIKNQIFKIFNDKKETLLNLTEQLLEFILSGLNNYDYMENERSIIYNEFTSIKNMINNNYNISLEKISNILTIKNNYYFKFNESIKIIENLLYFNESDIFDNITNDSIIIENKTNPSNIIERYINDTYISQNIVTDSISENNKNNSSIIQNNINDESISSNIENDSIKIRNNENETDIINNSSIDSSIYENNTYKDKNKLRLLENENITSIEKEIKEELKFKREYDRIKKLFIENNYFIEIDKNMMPEIDINSLNLYLEKMKFNISYEVNQTIDNYLMKDTNNNFSNVLQKIIKQFENLYNLKNDSTEILYQFNKLNPSINANFINEIEKDLNLLYSKLIDMVSFFIKSKEYYDKGKEIKFEDEKKKYYEIISGYIKNANKIKYNINSNDSEYNNKTIKAIIFDLYKRKEEEQINNIKLYLEQFYSKKNNFKNGSNILFKLYEEKMKKGIFNSSYLYIYKQINNQTFKFIDINNNKTTVQDIEKMALNLYENKFVEKNINISIYPKEIIILIEEEINKLLEKIKTVIENSIKEAKYTIFDGIYLKRHITNDLMNKINLSIPKNKDIDNNLDIFYGIIESINKNEKDYYFSKMNSILLENYKIFLTDYYRDYFKNEMKNKILLKDNFHFSILRNYLEQFLNEKYEKAKIETIFISYYLINEKISFMNHDLKSSIYGLIEEKENNKDFYLSSTLKNNKDILINNFLDFIFREDLMNNLFLTKEYKNFFTYNETIYDFLSTYFENIIIEKSSNEITNDYKKKKEYINSQKNYENKTKYIITYQRDNSTLNNLIKTLYQQYNEINYNKNYNHNNSFQILNQNISKILKISGIEHIINLYQNFSEYFDNELEDIIDKIIANNSIDTNILEPLYIYINPILKTLENYSINFIEEIKSYFNELKLFAMIDGLNYIPIERAEELRSVWDVKKESIRNLDEFDKEEKNDNKNKKLRRLNINFLSKIIDEHKDNILKKMENLYNISSIKNFQEYNSSDLHNSSSEPINLYDILNMTGNLIDDVNNLLLRIKNNYYYNKIKTKIEKNLELLELKEKSNQMAANLFHSNYLSGLFYFSSSEQNNHTNFGEKIIKNDIHNNIEYKINDTIFNFCDTLEKKIFNYTNAIAYKTIFSTYKIYTNIIFNKSKILYENDILKKIKFEKNNQELPIEVIEKFKMLSNVIKEYEIRLILEIEKDIDNLLNKSIKDPIKYDKEETDEKTDEEGDDDYAESYNLDIIVSDERMIQKGCYNIDLKEKYLKDLFPMYIKNPKFPKMKIIIEPTANYSLNFEIYHKSNISQLSFYFNYDANISLNTKLGIYSDIMHAKVDFTVNTDKVKFTGYIGAKYSIDFTGEKLRSTIYSLFSGDKFKLYLMGSITILSNKTELFNYYSPEYDLRTILLLREFTFYMKNNEIDSETLIKEM